MNGRFEIINHLKIQTNDWDAYEKEYLTHIGYGASGMFDTKTNKGYIMSCKDVCLQLLKQGYKHLKFCNGGDDDFLVVDHLNKEFGFFEYGYPCNLENILDEKTLTNIWENC